MPLYVFYTMVQISQKWPKTQIKGVLLRRNAQRIVQSCKNDEGLPIQVHGDRHLFMQKIKSPNQPVYIDMAQERSQVFWT